MRTEMMAASSSSEKVFRRPSSIAIAVAIAILIGAVAAGVVSLALIVGSLDTEKPVVYGIGTSPSGTVKAYGDQDQRLLLFSR
ncbi:MAG: hypothetical protein ACREAY_02750 [Nitrososphaera sp.]|uniref:hypothetical protein n=1 Tax=Nitrososphaera sp. TaxID=1971748 RepID=UPI003D6E9471